MSQLLQLNSLLFLGSIIPLEGQDKQWSYSNFSTILCPVYSSCSYALFLTL